MIPAIRRSSSDARVGWCGHMGDSGCDDRVNWHLRICNLLVASRYPGHSRHFAMQTGGNERAQAMLRQQGIHDWSIEWADYTTVCRLLTFQFFNIVTFTCLLRWRASNAGRHPMVITTLPCTWPSSSSWWAVRTVATDN